MMRKRNSVNVSRRNAIASLGAIAGSSLLVLAGCGGGGTSPTPTPTPAPTPTPTPRPTPTPTSGWASGGTKAITVNVPPENPFANDTSAMCQVVSPFTLGPCYFNPDDIRQDISDGEVGVPVILAMRILDKNCRPLSAIEVDIWHCNAEGAYSGNSADSSDASDFDLNFCTGSNQRARSSKWFRGAQVTDSDGVVYFRTCFPGWYPGRTTHIHFQLRANNVQTLVSQLGFDDGLSDEIHTNHSEYSTRGRKDTTNASDGVFNGNTAGLIFSTKRNADNSMLAWKTIQLANVG